MLEQASKMSKSLCPLCGKVNECAIEIQKETGIKQTECWCVGVDFSTDLLAQIPISARGEACICAACAAKSGSDLPAQALSG